MNQIDSEWEVMVAALEANHGAKVLRVAANWITQTAALDQFGYQGDANLVREELWMYRDSYLRENGITKSEFETALRDTLRMNTTGKMLQKIDELNAL